MALHIGILPGNDEDRGHLHMGIFNLENRLSTFTNDCLLVRSIELAKSNNHFNVGITFVVNSGPSAKTLFVCFMSYSQCIEP